MVTETVKKRKKYFKLYEDDIIDKEILASRLDEITNEVNNLEIRKQTLKEIIDNNSSKPIPFETVKEILFNFNKAIKNAIPEQQKTLLQLIIKEIQVTDRKDINGIKLKFDEKIIKYILENGGSPDDGGDPPTLLKKENLLLLMVQFTLNNFKLIHTEILKRFYGGFHWWIRSSLNPYLKNIFFISTTYY